VKVLVIETQPAVPLGSLGPPLVAAGMELVHWRTPEGAPPDSLSDLAGIVALDGPANRDEEERYPWIPLERELLASAVGQKKPIVGSCLGAELLAGVLGARLRRLPRPEIGRSEFEQTAAARDDALGVHLGQRLSAFQWHGYAFDLAPNAHLLSGSEHKAEAFSFEASPGDSSSTSRPMRGSLPTGSPRTPMCCASKG
jgi:GMP synthase (glutamine-hydrolysing)